MRKYTRRFIIAGHDRGQCMHSIYQDVCANCEEQAFLRESSNTNHVKRYQALYPTVVCITYISG